MPVSICLLSTILSVAWLKVNVSCLSMPLSKCLLSAILSVTLLRIYVSSLSSCLSHASVYPVCYYISFSFFSLTFSFYFVSYFWVCPFAGGGGAYFLFFNEEKLYSCLQMHFFNPCQFVLEQWLAGNYLKTYIINSSSGRSVVCTSLS